MNRAWLQTARLFALGGAPGASRLEFAVSLLPDLRVPPFEAIVRCDVADRTVKPRGVVLLHEVSNHPARILQAEWRLWAHGLGLQGAVPALDLAVRLRVVR